MKMLFPKMFRQRIEDLERYNASIYENWKTSQESLRKSEEKIAALEDELSGMHEALAAFSQKWREGQCAIEESKKDLKRAASDYESREQEIREKLWVANEEVEILSRRLRATKGANTRKENRIKELRSEIERLRGPESEASELSD